MSIKIMTKYLPFIWVVITYNYSYNSSSDMYFVAYFVNVYSYPEVIDTFFVKTTRFETQALGSTD